MRMGQKFAVVLLVSLPLSTMAPAAIPLIINHQGIVRVNGVPYTGVGTFKFAILDGASNYLWTNDGSKIGENAGTLVAPNAPSNGVTVTCTNGFYSVGLGNADLTNMTALPSSVFDSDTVFLRVIFNDGVNGQIALGDERLTATAYAYHAAYADTAGVAETAEGITGYVYGGVISNSGADAVNDLDISSGVFRSEDDTFNIKCDGLVKRYDAVFAAGNNAGGRLASESLPSVLGIVYIWAIGDSSGVNNGDYLLSQIGDSASLTLPSGYDKLRLIGGRCWTGPTNGWMTMLTLGKGASRVVHVGDTRTNGSYPTVFYLNSQVDEVTASVDLSEYIPTKTCRSFNAIWGMTTSTTSGIALVAYPTGFNGQEIFKVQRTGTGTMLMKACAEIAISQSGFVSFRPDTDLNNSATGNTAAVFCNMISYREEL